MKQPFQEYLFSEVTPLLGREQHAFEIVDLRDVAHLFGEPAGRRIHAEH